MSLSRSPEPSWYIRSDDRHILQRMDETYQHSVTIQQSFWSEADIDSRFRAGDQTLWEDIYGNLPAFRKRQFQFNRIRRICNMITGHQRRHRKSTMYAARENGSEQTAAQFTKLSYWWMDSANIYETISSAFDCTITTGMSLLSFWADYRSDPISGDPKVNNLSYNEFLIDPYFKKHDLSDCNYVWTRKFLSKVEAKTLYPEQASLIDSIQPKANTDGKFQFLPESYNYGMQNLLYYDEYWYRDYRKQILLVDTRTGETTEWKGDKENLTEYLKKFKNVVTTVEQTIPTVKLATVVEGHVLYNGENPLGIDNYPFVPVLGYYDPQIPYFPWRIQGVVRGLRDAQYLYNRRRVIELDILESQINSGWKVKEDALVNPKDALLSGQGRLLTLKQEAQMSDVEKIQPAQVPPSMIQLSELLGKEVQEISGVNEELLGSADDDKAGILSMLRQGAGLTTLQILFDQLDQAQKYVGQLFLSYAQNNFTPGKVERIIREKPTTEFYHRCFGKYDATVEEGVYTSTQKKAQFLQLLHLKEIGLPIPTKDLLENAPLSNKMELIESIKQEEENQAKSQNEQMALQLRLLQSQINDLESRATANKGLGIERVSRVEENRALAIERLAESKKDQQLGVLHLVKALKELESMDLTQLKELLDISKYVAEQSTLQVEGAPAQEIDVTKEVPAEQIEVAQEKEIPPVSQESPQI